MCTPRRNVLLLNFPHYGHMIPLLELGKKLSHHHNVDFLVSSSRLLEIQSRGLIKTNDTTESSLSLVGLDDGLPLDVCNVVGDPALFQKRLDIISSTYKTYLKTHSPDVVIADYFLYAAAEITHDKGVPFYFFNTASAMCTLDMLTGRNFHELDYENTLRIAMKNATSLATGVIFNSAREIDAAVLPQIMANPILAGKSLRFIGPLFSGCEEPSQSVDLRSWLDAQETRSLVYVSFGSLSYPTPRQLLELGNALLSLEKPFILSLPKEHQQFLPEELFSESSPNDANTGRKFQLLDWSPQKMILANPAVSLFVSHCGWNSMMEALFWGIPVVGWPMFGDQFDNAEWLRNNGVGEVVEGTGQYTEHVASAEEIERVVRRVAQWDGSSEGSYQRTAAEWKDVLRRAIGPDGRSTRDFVELVKVDIVQRN